jgi:hypothetical protein
MKNANTKVFGRGVWLIAYSTLSQHKDNHMNTRSKAEAVLQQIRRMREEVAVVKELYTGLFPGDDFVVEDRQYRVWHVTVVCESLDRTTNWYNECLCAIEEWEAKNGRQAPKSLLKTKVDILRYAFGVMKRKSVESGAAADDGSAA